MTKSIWDGAQSPYPHMQALAWGGALFIMVFILGLNILVRLLFQRGKEW